MRRDLSSQQFTISISLARGKKVFSQTGKPDTSHPPAGQLVEHLLVELLVGVLAPHGEEDVAPDELVDDLAVGREAAEDDVLVPLVVQLDHHVLRLPVHVPGLKKRGASGFGFCRDHVSPLLTFGGGEDNARKKKEQIMGNGLDRVTKSGHLLDEQKKMRGAQRVYICGY